MFSSHTLRLTGLGNLRYFFQLLYPGQSVTWLISLVSCIGGWSKYYHLMYWLPNCFASFMVVQKNSKHGGNLTKIISSFIHLLICSASIYCTYHVPGIVRYTADPTWLWYTWPPPLDVCTDSAENRLLMYNYYKGEIENLWTKKLWDLCL